jgi:His-Xaa-Ser system protein HxsD
VDSSIYPTPAILKAAYWIGPHCYVRLVTTPDGKLFAELTRKKDCSSLDFEDACQRFQNYLIDFALRERLAVETRGIQEVLMKQAFGEALPRASSIHG